LPILVVNGRSGLIPVKGEMSWLKVTLAALKALPHETVSKLSRLKEKKIRLIATQYRTWSGSDRMLDLN